MNFGEIINNTKTPFLLFGRCDSCNKIDVTSYMWRKMELKL